MLSPKSYFFYHLKLGKKARISLALEPTTAKQPDWMSPPRKDIEAKPMNLQWFWPKASWSWGPRRSQPEAHRRRSGWRRRRRPEPAPEFQGQWSPGRRWCSGDQICISFTQAFWFWTNVFLYQKVSYLFQKLTCTDSLVFTSLFDLYQIFVKFPCEYK